MTRVIVQFCVNGKYGETTARSDSLSAQQIVDKLHQTAKSGVYLRFLGENGILTPTGYEGDAREYIEH